MSIEPEVIPESSNEGSNAINLTNYWFIYLALIIGSIIIILVLKILIETILIFLGLMFIWKLASSRTP
tara:strand:+ start:304 stop:507 length:204 start_codon:yes stop_codon:yes gene_type:complete